MIWEISVKQCFRETLIPNSRLNVSLSRKGTIDFTCWAILSRFDKFSVKTPPNTMKCVYFKRRFCNFIPFCLAIWREILALPLLELFSIKFCEINLRIKSSYLGVASIFDATQLRAFSFFVSCKTIPKSLRSNF